MRQWPVYEAAGGGKVKERSQGWSVTQARTGPVRPPRDALLTAVQGQVPGGCGGAVEYGPVQKVDGGLCVDDLEHLAEQQTQLLRRRLEGRHHKLRCKERQDFAMMYC